MKFPDKCPACKRKLDMHGEGKPVYFLQRAEPDVDNSDPHRIVDSIWECSECHALFRFRWKLVSVHKLEEVEINGEG